MKRPPGPICCYYENNTNCLIRISHNGERGYGRIQRDGEAYILHRWIFLLNNGFLPPLVRHICNNSRCINISHLAAGTSKDNSHDMVKMILYIKQERKWAWV